ncbi:MAG: hypothetical protein FD143_960 [Ignavibacteria bacterium]|nr:MAG: hypothetical protein FD143_960 [Ignavibacteria bacterium]KAF0161202.1 MAG: hypothetical protein FD188_1113 [Ignavibacteria bacterium]
MKLKIPAADPINEKIIINKGIVENSLSNQRPKKNIKTTVAANCVPKPKYGPIWRYDADILLKSVSDFKVILAFPY